MAGVLWREYKDYADVKEITMAFAKATIAQQVALRDALVKTEQLQCIGGLRSMRAHQIYQ